MTHDEFIGLPQDDRVKIEEAIVSLDKAIQGTTRVAYPCPHGRQPTNGADGWKHCPHCLGLNRQYPVSDMQLKAQDAKSRSSKASKSAGNGEQA